MKFRLNHSRCNYRDLRIALRKICLNILENLYKCVLLSISEIDFIYLKKTKTYST